MTTLDFIDFLPFVILLCICVGNICKRWGHWQGFDEGYEAGRNDEQSHLNARVVRAKHDAFLAGCTVGLATKWKGKRLVFNSRN